jgi:hypothetical protein
MLLVKLTQVIALLALELLIQEAVAIVVLPRV